MKSSFFSLKRKILITLLCAGLLPLFVISVVVNDQASSALETQAFHKLVAVRDTQKQQIENYFLHIHDQVETLSSNPMVVDAAKGFRTAFKSLGKELNVNANINTYQQGLEDYYNNAFGTEYLQRTGKPIEATALIPTNKTEAAAQYHYIANNPHPLGEKHLLDSTQDGSSYDKLHQRYHPTFRFYLEKFGYYDIFIVEPKSGNIIYSVFKELDFATSLKTGPYKNTNFSKAFQQAAASGKTSDVFLEDFDNYTPSYEAAASFIASPIVDEGNLVGVLIFQMPVDRINAIMGQRSGLGKTGQSYLIGPDKLMRSQSPFEEKSSILHTYVDSEAVDLVVKGQTGEKVITLPSGETKLSAYTPIHIDGVNWGLLSEINSSEAFEAVYNLYWYVLVLVTVTALILVLLALSFAHSVNRQLGGDPSQIEHIARNIAKGNLDINKHDIKNPTGVYKSMVTMRENLTQSIDRDIQHMVNSARQGDLSQRVNLNGKEGFYRDLSAGINALVEECENITNDTLRVFEALSKGGLNQTYEKSYTGSFDQVKQNANATISKLQQVIEGDIQGLVNAAVNGDLSQRIDLSDKQGFFANISSGINQLVGSVEHIFEDASGAIKALAEGKLNQSITTNYQGDFEELKSNINTSIGQLDQIVIKLRDSGEKISLSANEVHEGSTNLTERTEQQAKSLEQTSANLEELIITVKSTADNSAQAEQVTSEAKVTAVKGGKVMQDATLAMEEISQSSQKIAEIIGVIDDIAFQTNLLALNASVEAARAGEQGRGFAVVATEVRNLAGRSATSAKEIKELINDSVNKVSNGVQLVRQSSENLSDIVKDINQVGSIVNEIATASLKQSAGIKQISHSVTNMESLTQKNATLAEETTAVATSMSNQSCDMKQRLGFFEVSDN